MTTRWHIGAKQLRGAIASYAKRFDFLEIKVGASAVQGAGKGVTEEPGPTPAALRRWRKAVPPHFHFAVVAGTTLSRLRPGKDADEELDVARKAVDVLQARCFVLRTPPEVTPAQLWRDRLAKVIERVPHDVTHFVWEPSGVWELADAAHQASKWGIVLSVDPTREVVPSGSVAYVRLRSLGATQSFGTPVLERVVSAVGARREVFAVIESDSALAEAKRLRQIVRQGPLDRAGGMGRLVRPRSSIVVGDDEQE